MWDKIKEVLQLILIKVLGVVVWVLSRRPQYIEIDPDERERLRDRVESELDYDRHKKDVEGVREKVDDELEDETDKDLDKDAQEARQYLDDVLGRDGGSE